MQGNILLVIILIKYNFGTIDKNKTTNYLITLLEFIPVIISVIILIFQIETSFPMVIIRVIFLIFALLRTTAYRNKKSLDYSKLFFNSSFNLSSGMVNTWLKKPRETIFSSPSNTTLPTLQTK